MRREYQQFNAQELCSRKLWEMVSHHSETADASSDQLRDALQELSARRHYLIELERIGLFSK